MGSHDSPILWSDTFLPGLAEYPRVCGSPGRGSEYLPGRPGWAQGSGLWSSNQSLSTSWMTGLIEWLCLLSNMPLSAPWHGETLRSAGFSPGCFSYPKMSSAQQCRPPPAEGALCNPQALSAGRGGDSTHSKGALGCQGKALVLSELLLSHSRELGQKDRLAGGRQSKATGSGWSWN